MNEKEPTKEAMLDCLNVCLKKGLEFKMYEIFRRLIKSQPSQPEVDEKFIEKWVKNWMQDDINFIRGELVKMLKKIPVRIKEA